ncbi:N-acetyltransferase [Ktedonobacteria bacterium brp13]|nr:N-acetyltransferase [Ktedonobacteria bacterium brp13]
MITVHRVKAEELLQVKELLSATWIDTYGHFLSERTIQKVTAVWHHPDALQAQAKDPTIYFGVAKDETDKIVGLVTVQKVDAHTLFMARLYVHPQYQRQGIGGQLMSTAIHAFPGMQKLQLEVEEQNQKGLTFYVKQGFQRLRVQQEEIEGELLHSILMEKEIGS